LTRRSQCRPITGDPPTLSLDVPKGASVTTASGVFDNFVTATVPEPSTWTMMLAGFAGPGFAGYRRSRKAVSIAVQSRDFALALPRDWQNELPARAARSPLISE
jgi:hypothetical protein